MTSQEADILLTVGLYHLASRALSRTGFLNAGNAQTALGALTGAVAVPALALAACEGALMAGQTVGSDACATAPCLCTYGARMPPTHCSQVSWRPHYFANHVLYVLQA